ncbi:MAG: hypothetical protein C5B52_18200 [Bacteroidetes bacterium]|nr:MAG: hypothetical protein C5B52_18200 [Bacteroidota bacterium]
MSVSGSENINLTIEHLFRRESSKLISTLTKIFGPHNLELAEDVVQDTLLKAMNTWKFNGIPDNPGAWLFKVAKNSALDVIRKSKRQQEYASNISNLLKSEYTLSPTLNEIMGANTIEDDLLRMIFTCCHPALSKDSQVTLILKTLCGFSVNEISRAFITSTDTIEKRLYRARQQLRELKIDFEIPVGPEVSARLESVLTTIYLLFNEGYHSTKHIELVRKDMLQEALRLSSLVCSHPSTALPQSFALHALLHLNGARVGSRLDSKGNILVLKNQDRNLWDREMIRLGLYYLNASAEGEQISRYHLEAAIAAEHVMAPTYEQTNWENIIRFYDLLIEMHPSPVIELNRAIAISELHGAESGIREIENIRDLPLLKNYYLLPATLGELCQRMNDNEQARKYFSQAMHLTNSPSEKKFLDGKLNEL